MATTVLLQFCLFLIILYYTELPFSSGTYSVLVLDLGFTLSSTDSIRLLLVIS